MSTNILRAMKNNGSPEPLFDSDDDRSYFLIRLPLHERAMLELEQAAEQVTPQVTPQVESLLVFCTIPRSREEMQQFLALADREHFRKAILKPLLEQGLLHLTMPDKPTNPKQKYYSGKR